MRPLGRPVIEAYFGGRLARSLEKEGEGAAAFTIEELTAQLGSSFRQRLRPLVSTAWARDPFGRGSYSHALRAGPRVPFWRNRLRNG